MGTTITVRNIDPKDKSWLKQEARIVGISMEEFVRRLIRDNCEKSERISQPSEIFRRYFGPEHGIDLPLNERFRYQPVLLPCENKK